MITNKSNIEFLTKFNAWRRDVSEAQKVPMPNPIEIGLHLEFAIKTLEKHEVAIDILNKIAAMPRKTKEQRLASSCVTFLESLDE